MQPLVMSTGNGKQESVLSRENRMKGVLTVYQCSLYLCMAQTAVLPQQFFRKSLNFDPKKYESQQKSTNKV